MAVAALSTTDWEEFTGPGILQVRGGRAFAAASDTPDTDDWIVLPDGAMIAVAGSLWLRSAEAAQVAVQAAIVEV